ncbi:hypothetical protein NBRC116583_07920 [Arenicella sp. 4NH20-0111]|uniref:hypothetical protein n=1 Tax=Arenicella sp. 4NH20-0111 TaxID=3127648 RepID=UPI0031024DF6
MGESLLNQLAASNVPLIEIVVRFKEGIDYKNATEQFNSLGEDIHLSGGDWYNQPNLRVGDASAEALFRLFGWKVHRVPLILEGHEKGATTESEYYCWDELEPQCCLPSTMQDIIGGISFSQPGSNDEGQWYEPKFA